jgi:hypothetical protein
MGEGSGETLPQVKQRTGMIIFAAAAGRMGSPVARGGWDGWGIFARFFPFLLDFLFMVFIFIKSNYSYQV